MTLSRQSAALCLNLVNQSTLAGSMDPDELVATATQVAQAKRELLALLEEPDQD